MGNDRRPKGNYPCSQAPPVDDCCCTETTVSDKPSIMRFLWTLPLLIGMIAVAIVGAIMSIHFPPESPLDKTYYLVVHTGLGGSFGLLCGYLLMLARFHRIRPLNALLIILFVLLFACLIVFFH